MLKINKMVEGYIQESKIDYIGLWQISASLQIQGISSQTDIKAKALHIAKQLIAHDIMPGYLAEKGFDFWPGYGDELIQRMLKEWPTGENPNLGNCDIWFCLKKN